MNPNVPYWFVGITEDLYDMILQPNSRPYPIQAIQQGVYFVDPLLFGEYLVDLILSGFIHNFDSPEP
ncbi:hypothetical protein Sjap_014756 [Stephania japonica]|uniref:Uncharacterized protein n=1 Tax=Stephania japonica TaxID=461633 RepID=A0AAP0NRS7_9MAGN